MKFEIEENPMRRYLLGDLPDAEITALEEQLFADDEKFEQACETENKLIEGYVRGRLPSEDQERFERHYLASPVHRRRVGIARNLIEQADELKAETIAPEPQVPWPVRLSEKLSFSHATWRFAALTAAAMLLLATSGLLWLFLDRMRLRDELAQLKAESEAGPSREQALADQIAAARGESEILATELKRLGAERNSSAPQLTPPAQAPRPSTFSFLLSPLLVRGGGDPQTLTIPPKTDVVSLRMKAEAKDARRFQASVRTIEGRQIWQQRTIKPRIDGAGNAAVAVHIPAGKLIPGDYILTLSSVNLAGALEEVNRYFFRVSRR